MRSLAATLAFFICFAFPLFSQFTSVQHSITNTYNFVEIADDESLVVIGGIKQAKSLDGGNTFTTMNLGNYELPFSSIVYHDAAIVDQNEFCLVGEDDLNNKSVLIKTYDGGSSWTFIMGTPNGSNDYYNDIEYGNGVMIISTEDGIYRSTDDGDNWNFISVYNSNLEDLTYNSITDSWLLKRYNFSYFISNDNGLSWTSANVSFSQSGYVQMLNNHYDQFTVNIVNQGFNSGFGTLYLLNENMIKEDSVVYKGGLTDGDPIMDIYFLPNSDLIASGIGHFFYIDSITSDLFHYNHHLEDGNGTPVQTTDFEMSDNFGIAVGQYGAISRFDPAANQDLYVPSIIEPLNFDCPGDTLTASSLADYADSSVWFYNGNRILSDTDLTYVTPYNFGSNQLKLVNWYNGLSTVDSVEVYYDPLQPAPNYDLNYLDSLPCLGEEAVVQIGYNGGPTYNASAVNAWLGDSLIYSQSPAPDASWTNFLTPEIYQDDSIYIVSSYQQTCGTAVDSLEGFIYAGDDLSDNFTYLPGPDSICELTQLNFYFSNTFPYNDISVTSGDYNWSEEGDPYQGGSDTLEVVGPSPFGISQMNGYKPFESGGFEITIVDTNNCTFSTFLDSITYATQRVDFGRVSDSYNLGDTVDLINYKPVSPTWSISPQNLSIDNIHDSVPDIYGQNEGIYEVKVLNEPVQGCRDSLTKSIFYGEELSLMNPDTCWNESHSNRNNIFTIKSDNQKNVYELSTAEIPYSINSSFLGFSLLKRNPGGSVLWEVRPDSIYIQELWAFDAILIEDVEVDANGDLICGLCIHSASDVEYGPIYWDGGTPWNQSNNYLVKIDGQTGDILWFKDLEYLSNVYGDNWTISDIHLKGGHIFYSLGDNSRATIYKADLSGNNLFSDAITAYGGTQYFIENNHFLNNGAPYSFENLKILELSTGELVCIGYYGGQLYNDSLLPQLNSLNNGVNPKPAIFIARFDENNGFYDYKRLASVNGLKALTLDYWGQIFADIDNQDNITLSLSWSRNESGPGVEVMDSTLLMSDGSCVFQIDEDFELNWISSFSHSFINSLTVASNTGSTFISGKTNGILAFDDGVNVSTIGSTEYASDISSFANLPDVYFAKLDSTGGVVDGFLYDANYQDPSLYNNPLSWSGVLAKMYSNPCEDLYTSINAWTYNQDTLVLKSLLDTMSLSGSISSKLSSNGCGGPCMSFDTNMDTVFYCSSSTEISLPFPSVYGVDSIGYEYWSNGTLFNTDTLAFFNNSLEIPANQNGLNDSIYITHPLNKVIILNPVNTSLPTYNYSNVLCKDEVSYAQFNNPILEYSVNGSPFDAIDSTLLPTNVEGDFDVFVSSVDSNLCVINDTISYQVVVPLADTFDYLTNLSCNDTLSYIFDSVIIQSDEWYLNGVASNNIFHSGNLVDDVNVVDVVLTDTNGCVYTDELLISFDAPILPTFNSFYQIDCNETEVIQYNAQDYSSVTFSIGGVPTQNSFGPNNLIPGSNTVLVSLTDINGCEVMDTITIEYCTSGVEANDHNNNGISVYPNPAEDYLYVDLNGMKNEGIKIKLIDNMGRIIRETKYQEKISVSELARGTYIIKLVHDSNVIFEKLIVVNH